MTDNQNRIGFLDFLKSVSDWPQPEVWFDADDREIGVCWDRGNRGVAIVVFDEDLVLSRWSYYSNIGQRLTDAGESEIPPDMFQTIKELALQ